ncbi:diaminopimelate epimerase [Oceanomicrobium pacificus]|uniref:Diaminopimelate epimerase n=1 Tax=Oceanomicrobium pacificus TaxID=2692916 RepID=A0A6B0TJD0_9RHOB|nr:diaminopimelate epimerase [Oceanomicrobium pacificus]MXU64540.1 diaminopimelate epimerase [Oceanomicrobium pacificus]
MDRSTQAGLPFRKMHGLGNDFVVIDARVGDDPMTPARARAIGDRHFGVGFDQLAVILPDETAAARVVYWNADGTTSDACGNATRCIAHLLMAESGADALLLRTGRGLLECADAGGGLVRVNMGPPQTGWRDIPLARDVDTLALPLDGAPVATGMGNPHCSYFVEAADAIDLATLGPETEHHPLFPERTNVQVVQVTGPDRLRVRVWERGVGPTLASGSSACAVTVAAVRRGLTGREVAVELDGGTLQVAWREDGVWMTGPVATVFEGRLDPSLMEAGQ